MKKNNNEERVIFRHTYDPYEKVWKYMCIFPDDPANPGNVCYVDIWKNGDKWWHDCYEEMHRFYVLKQKIIHKKDPIVQELVDALKGFYGGEYRVVEKMI